MNIYYAPMEGITGYRYRNVHHAFFGKHIDKYFTPFISPNVERIFTNRDFNDILPENNTGLNIIPQMLSNHASRFVNGARYLSSFGYKEINLNLGCPSKTVVSKGRGSGFLAFPDKLDEFLYEIFEQLSGLVKISIKTRIGKTSPDEFYKLIEIYNKYELEELIIHPRIQTDFYKNTPNMNVFSDALSLSKNKICYNGDIFTVKQYHSFKEHYKDINSIMLGRGLLMNPHLASEICGEERISLNDFKAFHDALYIMYQHELSGEIHVLHKMKELWQYMSGMFDGADKIIKKLKKSQRSIDYESAVRELFSHPDYFQSTEIKRL